MRVGKVTSDRVVVPYYSLGYYIIPCAMVSISAFIACSSGVYNIYGAGLQV
eukprot:XP_001705542.1 Hypothetical protein GL50803_32027 [Giardia lamblia ATCC 50803]